ncbi:MAG: FitA-like ribbon-helix-helix domain-containing protein [Acidimicrobiia bacterium]
MTDSMIAMRQMITRLDDDLHEALKRKAKAEGRSLNAFVVETLSQTVTPEDAQAAFVEELRSRGLLVEREPPEGPVLTLEELRNLDPGAGAAVLEALLVERSENR